MKTLIIYYSLEGTTEIIAKKIQHKLNASIIKLIPEIEPDKNSLTRFFWGGKSVFFNEKPELLNDTINLDEYDTIFIGSPVWSSNLTPPINSLISHYSFEHKKIHLFVTHKGSGEQRFFDLMKKRLFKSDILSCCSFKNVADPCIDNEINQWLDSI